MKTFFLTLFFMSYSCLAGSGTDVRPVYTAKTIKIAVIDTGFDFNSKWEKLGKDSDGRQLRKPKLCNEGHKDFTGTGIQDTMGHGTHVTGIIAKFAEDADYCIVVIKFYDVGAIPTDNFRNSAVALSYAYNLGVDMINYSGGGVEFALDEYLAVKKLLDRGVVFIAAAGNEKSVNNYKILKVDLQYSYKTAGSKAVYQYKPYFINIVTGEIVSKEPIAYYPAAYDARVISVANVELNVKTKQWDFASSSNRGDAINFNEKGVKVLSILPHNSTGYMTGTSQAAPTRAGKMLKMWNNK